METEDDQTRTDGNVVDLSFEEHVCVKPVPARPKATKAATTKASAGPGVTKARSTTARKPAQVKVKKTKVEIEFEKLTPKEQLAFLKAKMSLLPELEETIAANENCESNQNNDVVEDGKVSDEVSARTDGNLCMLRLELGCILASEAELRGKEKRLRLAIKREQRRLTMAQSPIKCDARETDPAAAIVQLLFIDEAALTVPRPCPIPASTATTKRLWCLAQQTSSFEEEVAPRLLDIARDATLSTTAALSLPVSPEGSPLRDAALITVVVTDMDRDIASSTREAVCEVHTVLESVEASASLPCSVPAQSTTGAPLMEAAEMVAGVVPDVTDCGSVPHSSGTYLPCLQLSGTADDAVEVPDFYCASDQASSEAGGGAGKMRQPQSPSQSFSQSQATALQYVDVPGEVTDMVSDGALCDVGGDCGTGQLAEARVQVSLFEQFAFREAGAEVGDGVGSAERPQPPLLPTVPTAVAHQEEVPRKPPAQPSIQHFLHMNPAPFAAFVPSVAGAAHCSRCEVVDLISPEATPAPAAASKPQGPARDLLLRSGSSPQPTPPVALAADRVLHAGGPSTVPQAQLHSSSAPEQDGSSQPPEFTPSSSQLAGIIHYIPDHEDGPEESGGDGSQSQCRCPCSQECRRRGARESRHPTPISARREAPGSPGLMQAIQEGTKPGGGGKGNEESQGSGTSGKSDTSHILNSPELPDFPSMPVQKLRDIVQHYGLKPDTKGRMVSLLRSMWQRLHREGETKRVAVSEVRYAQAVRAIPPAAPSAQDKNQGKAVSSSSGCAVKGTVVSSKASTEGAAGTANSTTTNVHVRVLGEKRRAELSASEVAAFIKARPEWYEQVLSYTPLDLDRLHAELNSHFSVASAPAVASIAMMTPGCAVSVAGATTVSAVHLSQSTSGTGTGTGIRISRARLLEILDSEAVFVSATQKPKRTKR